MKLKFPFRLLVIVSYCFYGFLLNATAQPRSQISYKDEMRSLASAIRTQYFDSVSGYYTEVPKTEPQKNKSSYLWPLCALFQAENEIAVSGDTQGVISGTFPIIQRYYDTRPPAPGYASYPPPLGGGDRFYDDNQWIGITLLDAYKRVHDNNYLDKGKEIYRFMMTAYDSTTGGGLYWEEGKPTKNTCSNGPGILLALQLYQATNEKPYLDTALMLYEWVNANLQDKSGLYYDNISTVTRRIDKKMYSYNTGTMLQSNVYLFEITGDKKYLDRATAQAKAASAFFYGKGRFIDNLWFNAVMLRGLMHLKKYNPDDQYLASFRRCVERELRNNRNKNGLIGVTKLADIVGQGGMLEILARFAQEN
jgi:hypothetical protein